MVTSLTAVYVPVLPDFSKMTGQVRSGLQQAFSGANRDVQSAGSSHGRLFGRSFSESGTREVEKGTGSMFSRVGQVLGKGGGQFMQFGSVIAGAMGVGTVAIGALAAGAVTMGVQTAASMEQAQIGFATLLGSEQQAQQFMQQLTTFAAQTPFELPGLVDASRLLLGVGVSAAGTMDALKAFGNAASAVGVGQANFQRIMLATSQAIGAGRFMTQDLNQITENGIPIWGILSRAMGKPIPVLRQLASHGKLLSSDVLPLLERQMNKDYGRAMERQSRSLAGVWSTFMDTLNLGLASVIRPLIPAMEVGLVGATKALTVVFGAIPRLFSGAGASGSAFTSIIRSLAGWVGGSLVPALRAFAARVLPQAQIAIRTVSAAFRDHQEIIQALGVIFQGLGLVITRVLIPALGIMYTIMLREIGPAVRVLLTVVGVVADVILAVTRGVPAIASAIGGGFASARRAVGGFVSSTSAAISGWVSGAARAIGGFASSTSSAIAGWASGAARAVAGFASSVYSGVVSGFRAAGTWLIAVGRTILNGLVTGFSAVWPHLLIASVHTVELLTGPFRGIANLLVVTGRNLIRGLINGVTLAGRGITAVINAVVTSPIGRAFAAAGTWLVGAGRAVVTGLMNGVRAVAGLVRSGAAATINFLRGPFASAVSWLVGAGRNVVAGLLNGVRALWGLLRSVIATTISNLRTPFNAALSWLIGAGRNVVTGLLNGVSAVGRTVSSFVTSRVITPARRAFSGALGWLTGAGRNVVTGLLNGIGAAARGIGSWVNNNLVQPIIRAVKGFFGIKSPSTVMAGIGGNIMAGLLGGILRSNPLSLIPKIFGGLPSALGAIVNKGLVALTSLPAKALTALGGIASKVGGLVAGLFAGGSGTSYSIGSGVGRWVPTILQALTMLGQPASWLQVVESRMSRESGGNPAIVNTTDSNWRAGTPSVGLMQVIGPTFAAYAGQFRGVGPFKYGVSTNPLANTYAGLNYALHRYGSLSALSRPGGYDTGGWLPPGGLGMNLTGSPERVLSPQESREYRPGARGPMTVHVYLDGERIVDDRVRVMVEDAYDDAGSRLG